MHDEFGIVGGTFTIEIPDESSPGESKFNRTNLSKIDLSEAHTYLHELSNADSPNLRRAALTAAIVAYARPFKKNHDGGMGRAEAKLHANLELLLTPEEQALHNRIIDLRDRAVAHSDYSLKPTFRVQGEVSPESGYVTLTVRFDLLDSEIDIEGFKRLARKLERHCSDELHKLNFALSASLERNLKQ